MSLHKLIISGN